MSHFDRAIDIILQHEGGYINHPDDPGGETNYGICKRDFPGLDIQGLSREDAIEIYRKNYWRPIYDSIADERIATKVFDMAVNMGRRQAHLILQRALGIEADGIFGVLTLRAINAADPDATLQAICREHAKFYRDLVALRPKMQVFLKGWLTRASWPEVTA